VTAPSEQADLMDLACKERLREAAERADRVYPGPVGELLRRELLACMVFGRRMGSRLVMCVADVVIGTPASAVELWSGEGPTTED
jgi:hypothetical protein